MVHITIVDVRPCVSSRIFSYYFFSFITLTSLSLFFLLLLSCQQVTSSSILLSSTSSTTSTSTSTSTSASASAPLYTCSCHTIITSSRFPIPNPPFLSHPSITYDNITTRHRLIFQLDKIEDTSHHIHQQQQHQHKWWHWWSDQHQHVDDTWSNMMTEMLTHTTNAEPSRVTTTATTTTSTDPHPSPIDIPLTPSQRYTHRYMQRLHAHRRYVATHHDDDDEDDMALTLAHRERPNWIRCDVGMMSAIVPGVWLSDATSRYNYTALIQHNITHVITIATEDEIPSPTCPIPCDPHQLAIPITSQDWPDLSPSPTHALTRYPPHLTLSITHHRFALNDDGMDELQPLVSWFVTLMDELRTRGEHVLVHCVKGRSRSPAFIIWYLLHHGWSLYDAFYHVLDRRPCIQPRYQLFDQLMTYERVLRGNNSVDHHHNYQVIGLG